MSVGQLGLSLHFCWGDQRVGEYFLRPGEHRAFSIGSTANADFAMAGPKFDVVRSEADGFVLHLSRRMTGTLERGAQTEPLRPGELLLEPGDRARVDLGGVTLDASFARVALVPPPPLSDSVDYTVLNAFVALLFIGALGAITATNASAAAPADDLLGSSAVVNKVLLHADPPATVRPIVLPQGAHSGKEGEAGKPDAPVVEHRSANKGNPAVKEKGREIAQKLVGGLGQAMNAVLSEIGTGGELAEAVGHIKAPVIGDAHGLGGMGLKGDGPGGGGLEGSNTFGLALHTIGRGDPRIERDASARMGPKQNPDIPQIEKRDPETPYDRDLIRKVIHQHSQQLRYCYELALQKRPSLVGRVSVAFTIGAGGVVSQAAVASSDVHEQAMEDCIVSRVHGWIFPRVPAGWVKVTYPFVFKPTGE